MLNPFVTAHIFSSLDVMFAERLLHRTGQTERACAAFLATVMALSRRGHVCIELSEHQLSPLCTAAPHLLSELLELCRGGIKALPPELIAEVDENETMPLTPLCRRGEQVYLQKNWVYESQVIAHVNRLKHAPLMTSCALEEIDPSLNKEQRQAVMLALRSSLSLITGGPGTGKTFTAAHLVRACILSLPPVERSHFRVILAAPTGKAVAHLEANLMKLLSDVSIAHLKVGTLHALLEVRADSLQEQEPPSLSADLILVDECSMIDAELFARLFAAVLSGSRLVLIGDPDQLPPVEAGSFFADLIASQACATTQLSASLRMESQGIVHLASLIQKGEAAAAIAALKEGNLSGIEWKDLQLKSTSEAPFTALLRTSVHDRFPVPSVHQPDPQGLIAQGGAFRILSCMRQGPYGVDAINQVLFQQFASAAKIPSWLAVPIMITRNDDAMQLSNGDTGWLIKWIDPQERIRKVSAGELAYFPDQKTGVRTIAALALPAFEYAYCLSVHKSQGSEYNEILLLIPPGSESFGREVLYTAVTRARRRVMWDGPAHVVEACVQTSSRKNSGIIQRLPLLDVGQ